jgi:C4-dicarboxylate-specific signal transduction histidine kinase
MKLHVPRLPRSQAEGVDTTARHHTRRLEARVAALEEAVEESRRLNQRLADVIDVVTELLVPALDRNDERLVQALANLNKTLDDG